MSAPFEIPHTWEEPEDLHAFLEKIREQQPDANLRKIRYAYYLAEQAHSGQTRLTGEPYITHPLAVADILADLKMDEDSICAALLHDTLEDNIDFSPEKIKIPFGEEVLNLVEGVTKLKFKAPDGTTERQRKMAETHRAAESLRKMLLAMAKDIRVMVIKLADRLHNMRTLDGQPQDKRIRISSETLDIYAPLAARLGIWQMKWQLEDLAFKYLHPHEYAEIQQLVAKTRTEREEELREAIITVKEALISRGVKVVEVQGRPKHLYSIFNKIVKYGFKFEEILDLIAMRIVVNDKADCYVAFGIVNELWTPMMQHFADYIARPKSNGYQSLHIKVIGPRGEPLEIQIRTKAMHEIAEMGVAAHYAYKEGKAGGDQGFSQLRQQLFDWSTDTRTSSDFLRNLSSEVFSEQVFVFTPKGDVVDLPANSTPVDFAFRVHTNLGLRLIGSKVNGVIAPLSHRLQNGDVVELITRNNATPSMDWLEFVQSASAKSKLRGYFRSQLREVSVARGREALERELRSIGIDPKAVLGEPLNIVSAQIKDCKNGEDVFAKIGEGLASVQNVVTKLRGTIPKTPTSHVQKSRETGAMHVAGGLDKISMRRAKCCDPVPGEDVVGYVTRGRGVMIHRTVCSNALNYSHTEAERMIPMVWESDGENVYRVNLRIITLERTGLLAEVSMLMSESKANIVGLHVKPLKNGTFEWDVSIEVRDLDHLNATMNKVAGLQDVFGILRVHGRTGAK
ncbi:MAG: bifunctional (p)ppGpp synthetase/guanosine-3',5'-bis(diphosphate) 3'-pyrophosphohydrolase [Armatimonadetes bacterium]|nr:bifunctional (p)ppGpp synthetase/guanosine-3',5'-bis(diphosphate) 3'-pyrophosphohydrolase [Armatimonadota bacterium]